MCNHQGEEVTKYRAVKTEMDGIVFDSKKEAARYLELRQLKWARKIFDLEIQPTFQIAVNGVPICKYRADFRYRRYESDTARICDVPTTIIEDVKGMKTPVYRLKKKLVEAQYGIRITEV